MHTIYLEIENEILSAKITEVYNPVQGMVHIQFNDGYSNIFFVDCETGQWVEQDLGFTKLAKVVGEELAYVIDHSSTVTAKLKWEKTIINEEIFHFGFYKYLSGDQYMYEIFSDNRRYMFSLVKKSHSVWQIFKIPGTDGWNYNLKYEDIVPCLLEIGEM